jgi:hypothetical protein
MHKLLTITALIVAGLVTTYSIDDISMPTDYRTVTSGSRSNLANNFEHIETQFNKLVDTVENISGVISGVTGNTELSSPGSIDLRLDNDSNSSETFSVTAESSDTLLKISEDSIIAVTGTLTADSANITNITIGTNLKVGSGSGLVLSSSGLFSTVTDNRSNWDAAYTHVSNDGSDHSLINQDVTTGGSPSFPGLTVNGRNLAFGKTWTNRTSAADNVWYGVCYGDGLYVAVSASGSDRVMTSSDAINWTSKSIDAYSWAGICYGKGTYVTVSANGGGTTRAYISSGGNSWSGQTTPNLNFYGVCYSREDALFVAVGDAGAVMSSPDAQTWTNRTAAASLDWQGVCAGSGVFVAVAQSGTGNRVMTSDDGITWTSRTSAADDSWISVAYGNGAFVAVAWAGAGTRIMSSSDKGVTWTARTPPSTEAFNGVTYGGGLFTAIGSSVIMTSPDGITWTDQTAPSQEIKSVCYGNGMFVAVAQTGSGNRVITSGYALEPYSAVHDKHITWDVTTATVNTGASNWNDAYTHVSSTGVDHTYINQDVTTSGNPSFSGLTVGSGTGLVLSTSGVFSAVTDNRSNWDAAYTHISSNGTDHTYIDQDLRTTADPTFGNITCDYIQFSGGTGDAFSYNDTSFSGDFRGFSSDPNETVKLSYQGDLVTLSFNLIGGTSDSTGFKMDANIISGYEPDNEVIFVVTGQDNSSEILVVMAIQSDGSIRFYNGVYGGTFTASGNKYLRPCAVTYKISN